MVICSDSSLQSLHLADSVVSLLVVCMCVLKQWLCPCFIKALGYGLNLEPFSHGSLCPFIVSVVDV